MDRDKSFFRVDHLSKAFGGLLAVGDVSFLVEKESLTSLIGPNGAGKTTLFDLISGFLPADEGRIVFKGRDLAREKPHDIVSLGMARTFQHLGLFNQLSVWDNVFLGLPGKRRETLWGVFLPRPMLRREERTFEERTRPLVDYYRARSAHVISVPATATTRPQEIAALLDRRPCGA